MRLYNMSIGSRGGIVVPHRKTLCTCSKGGGGGPPLLLAPHHGAGMMVPQPVDLTSAKTILSGMNVRRKKYISI